MMDATDVCCTSGEVKRFILEKIISDMFCKGRSSLECMVAKSKNKPVDILCRLLQCGLRNAYSQACMERFRVDRFNRNEGRYYVRAVYACRGKRTYSGVQPIVKYDVYIHYVTPTRLA